MSGNSTLDPENLPVLPDRSEGQGHGIGSLGPSDSSDSGSDMQGKKRSTPLDPGSADEFAGLPEAERSDTDSQGTGERVSVDPEEDEPDGLDIDVDHLETVRPTT